MSRADEVKAAKAPHRIFASARITSCFVQTKGYATIMAVMVPRESWTDQRLDDLNRKVDDGFARVDKKIDDGFARVDKKIDDGLARVDKDIRELNTRFDSLQRTIIGAAVAVIVALIGSGAF